MGNRGSNPPKYIEQTNIYIKSYDKNNMGLLNQPPEKFINYNNFYYKYYFYNIFFLFILIFFTIFIYKKKRYKDNFFNNN